MNPVKGHMGKREGSGSSFLPFEHRWLMNRPIAHRGYHTGDGACPENSLEAFERAMGRGFAIELDVHMLADGNIAVFHDDRTLRMTGVDRLIADCTTPQVRKMHLAGGDQTIPLLDDVLDLVRGEVPLLIELKHMGPPGGPERALLKKIGSCSGSCAVQSFNPRSLRWFKIAAPDLPRGQLSGRLDDLDLAFHKKLPVRYLLTNPLCSPLFIGYDVHCLPTRRTSSLRARGIPLIGWTVCSMEEYRRVAPLVDNIIFEGFDPPRNGL
jgi:glycerophosphoryl diester phosphodiesterase